MANNYSNRFASIDAYDRWKKPYKNYGYPTYGMKDLCPQYDATYHRPIRYTISLLVINAGEEIENEIDIEVCCSYHHALYDKKFEQLVMGCQKAKTFIVPKTVNDQKSFFSFVKTNPIKTR